MLINGEKFACEACVRGHRVSSCQHQDRPLIHVNKKGRPISQCHHCRGLRKARAQHVKCDCAEKGHAKEDCPHEKGENKDQHVCCCGHGARCSCSLKKDHHLDTVPEDIPQLIQPAVLPKEPHRPRLNNMNSHESKTTVFTNGHHKPVHKINDAHNKCGAPYKIPNRAHTVHGHREIAQRSTDSLPLTKSTFNSDSVQHPESVTSAPQPVRMVKSEQGSPDIKPALDVPLEPTQNIVIPPLDSNAYSYSPFDSNSPSIQQGNQPDYQFPERFPEGLFMSYEQAHEYEPPYPSAGLGEGAPEIDWSQFNFQTAKNLYAPNNNGYVPSQPPSYASFDHFSHLGNPGLNSSSGDISEVEDYVPVSRPENLRANSQDASNDFSSVGGDDTTDPYRLSSASSYIGIPQANVLATSNLESLDIDDYIHQAEAENRQLKLNQQKALQQQRQQQAQPQLQQQYQPVDQSKLSPGRNFSMSSSNIIPEHAFTVQEAQNYAHMAGRTSISPEQQPSPMAPSSIAEDMWCGAPEISRTNLDDEDDDDDWVR